MSDVTEHGRCYATVQSPENKVRRHMSASVAPVELINSLIYLDRAYISDLYEAITGESAATEITKNQGKRAGAAIPVFSAEVSTQETRTFPLSTLAMLSQVLGVLNQGPTLDGSAFVSEMPSQLGWIEGELSVFKTRSTVQRRSGDSEVLASDAFFQLRTLGGRLDLALITTPEYFSSGIEAFLRMQDTVLSELSLPVRAFVRVFAAK